MEQTKTKLKRLITTSILALSLLAFLNCKVYAQTPTMAIIGTSSYAADPLSNQYSATWNSPVTLCNGTQIILQAYINGSPATSSVTWSGGPGTVGVPGSPTTLPIFSHLHQRLLQLIQPQPNWEEFH